MQSATHSEVPLHFHTRSFSHARLQMHKSGPCNLINLLRIDAKVSSDCKSLSRIEGCDCESNLLCASFLSDRDVAHNVSKGTEAAHIENGAVYTSTSKDKAFLLYLELYAPRAFPPFRHASSQGELFLGEIQTVLVTP